MSVIKLTLPAGETITNGKLVTFTSPCFCTDVEYLLINGVKFTLSNSLGGNLANTNAFRKTSVTVALDTVNKLAVVQNSSVVRYADNLTKVLSVTEGGTGATKASDAVTNLGAVPKTRKVNNKALSSDINLTYSDVGAAPESHTHNASDINKRIYLHNIYIYTTYNNATNDDIILTLVDNKDKPNDSSLTTVDSFMAFITERLGINIEKPATGVLGREINTWGRGTVHSIIRDPNDSFEVNISYHKIQSDGTVYTSQSRLKNILSAYTSFTVRWDTTQLL